MGVAPHVQRSAPQHSSLPGSRDSQPSPFSFPFAWSPPCLCVSYRSDAVRVEKEGRKVSTVSGAAAPGSEAASGLEPTLAGFSSAVSEASASLPVGTGGRPEDELVFDVDALVESLSRVSQSTVTGVLAEPGPDVSLLRLLDGRTARLPASEFYPNRTLEEGRRYVLAVLEEGPRPLVSAAAPELPELILCGLVPELRSGQVRVMSAARQVGIRSKLAVAATQEGIDPVGAVLGRAASRVRAASALLLGERLDVVSYHPDLETFVVNSLAVRPVSIVRDSEGSMVVKVPAHQVQAALGGGNLNVALTARLTGCRVRVEAA